MNSILVNKWVNSASEWFSSAAERTAGCNNDEWTERQGVQTAEFRDNNEGSPGIVLLQSRVTRALCVWPVNSSLHTGGQCCLSVNAAIDEKTPVTMVTLHIKNGSRCSLRILRSSKKHEENDISPTKSILKGLYFTLLTKTNKNQMTKTHFHENTMTKA